MQAWLMWLFAGGAGILMAIQGSINGALGKIIGVLEGSFILHAVGLGIVTVLLFVFGLGKGDLSRVTEAPWYLYLGGVLNVAIIYGVMFAISRCGAGAATTAIITGQLAMSLVVDQFGLFGLEQHPITWMRGAGLVLMAVAAYLLLSK